MRGLTPPLQDSKQRDAVKLIIEDPAWRQSTGDAVEHLKNKPICKTDAAISHNSYEVVVTEGISEKRLVASAINSTMNLQS